MGRIADTFQRLRESNRTGIIAYVTVGFPDVGSTLELAPAIIEGGADMVELGVPFSDPLADGATIQRASQVALANGVTLGTCLDTCGALRRRFPLVPLILMGYYNPIFAYGLERYARDAQEAGADGVIVPDLPPEEAEALRRSCSARGQDVIFLLAPTSTDRRIQEVGRIASGFIYCVSLTGVTGARRDLPAELPEFIARVRRLSKTPLAVGFGVSTGEHVREIGRLAEAVIVGSALTAEIERAGPGTARERARAFVARLREGAMAAGRSG